MFPSYCEHNCENEAKCKAFHVKISFICIRIKTNIHNNDTEVKGNSEMDNFTSLQRIPDTSVWLVFLCCNYPLIVLPLYVCWADEYLNWDKSLTFVINEANIKVL